MKDMIIKRTIIGAIIVIIPCMCMSVNPTNNQIAFAADSDTDYLHEDVLGVPAFDETSLENFISHYDTEINEQNSTAPMDTAYSYGSSCDLSQSIYFPTIGYQSGGSCTSWATTYYQFTYEANKLNNVIVNDINFQTLCRNTRHYIVLPK